MLIASLLMGLALAILAYLFLDLTTKPRTTDPKLGRFEVDRRELIRAGSSTYRLFEPWVDELTTSMEKSKRTVLEPIQKAIASSGMDIPWTAAEFLAVRRIEAGFASVIFFFLCWPVFGLSFAALMLPVVFVAFEALSRRSLRSTSLRRQLKIKRRFASVIDLMALMMEVGAGFQEALNVATEESKGTPLGTELAIVRRDMTMGKREDALRNFVSRTQDEEIAEVVLAIVEGEQLGTPLAKIFRVQADQMRQKRSQWAEKASSEAEVSLVFPAMLIMIACLILVAAPFVLTALFDSGN
jgi:tight adherence protein C